MKNILHVVNIDFVIPYFLGEQLNYMTKRGYKIHLICSPSEYLKPLSIKYNFFYEEIPILRQFSFFTDFCSIIKICICIRKNKINIINGHTPKAGLLAMCAGFFMRVPKRIYFRHGLLYETSHGLKKVIFILSEKFASLLATKVVCVSPYLIERSIRDRLSSPTKLHLLYKGSCNGVDVYNKFNPVNVSIESKRLLRLKYNLPLDAWIIGYTGRLVKDKGIVELVEAFELLQKKYSKIYLLLVGPEEERDKLPLKTKHAMKCDNRIILTGLIENNIEYYYAIMNVLILPTHREGFGTSILEASSMQIPVVTTDFTGSRDAIVNGVTGLYTDGTPLSLVNKIEILYNDREYAINLGIQGRRFVEDNFEQQLVWKEIEKLYNLES